MASLLSVWTWFTAHQAVVFGALFGISEALAVLPGVKANSVFQAIYNFLKGKQAPSA